MKEIKCYLEITILGKDPELVKVEDFSPKTLIFLTGEIKQLVKCQNF